MFHIHRLGEESLPHVLDVVNQFLLSICGLERWGGRETERERRTERRETERITNKVGTEISKLLPQTCVFGLYPRGLFEQTEELAGVILCSWGWLFGFDTLGLFGFLFCFALFLLILFAIIFWCQ